MIIDKSLNIKITKKNINHYRKYFDVTLKDIIEIDIEKHLEKNSNKKINVKCDICGIERCIKYQAYTKNINSSLKYPIYTCDTCSHIKLKEYNMNHYGVEYYSQHPNRNEKVKKTSLERYGASHFSQSKYFKFKISKTNLKKFGFINPFMSEDIKEKSRQTKLQKYGNENFTNKSKAMRTNISRYGVEEVLKCNDIRKKIKITNLEKYGNEIPVIGELFRINNFKIASNIGYISYLGNNISLFKCDKGHNFEIDSSSYFNRIRSNLDLCTICYPIGNTSSIKEDQLYNYILSIYNGVVKKSYRDNLEIDIYLPMLKIGFEFNGLYWHSEEYKDRNYHLDKTNYFKERGIRIVHIWEDDWTMKSEIIKSQIKNLLKLNSEKIFARKCEVREIIDNKLIRIFLNENHIQGYVSSIKKIGLYYNNKLVSLMIFNKFEGRKKMMENEWNLARFCNILNTNIIGGASKLLNYFISNYSPNRIISYGDKDWSNGDLYTVLGFNKSYETKPDYKYIISGVRKNKQNFKKSNLKIDSMITESKYMSNKNFKRIWDCGKIKFELVIGNPTNN